MSIFKETTTQHHTNVSNNYISNTLPSYFGRKHAHTHKPTFLEICLTIFQILILLIVFHALQYLSHIIYTVSLLKKQTLFAQKTNTLVSHSNSAL